MSTFFVGSNSDAFITSPVGIADQANSISVASNGTADAYLVDPDTGERTSVQRLWTHGMMLTSAGLLTDCVPYLWFNAAGTPVVRLFTLPDYKHVLQYWSGTGWVNAGEPVVITGGPNTLDFFINIHPTAGALNWYVNSTYASEATRLDTSAIGDIARLRLGRYEKYEGDAYSHGSVILATYNTIGHTVRRRAPSGPGAHADWLGTYEDVDDDRTNDSDAINSSTVGDISTFTASPFSPTITGSVIKTVAVACRIRNDGSVVPTNARAIVRTAGVDYIAPKDITIGAGFRGAVTCFDVDPGTGRPWASIDRANGEFGLKATE